MPAEDLYRRLQQHLDRSPVGFPPTRSGVEIRILERLFTPQQAEFALALGVLPEPASIIRKRLAGNIPLDQLRQSLDAMAANGLIQALPAKGQTLYSMLPFAIGIFELQLPRLTAEFERDVRQYLDESFHNAWAAGPTRQMRTVPVNAALAHNRNVSPHDDIAAWVRRSQGPFAAIECICRKGRALTGRPCTRTSRHASCLIFGRMAAQVIQAGLAASITRGEMLALLTRADRDGLVLQPQNTQDPMFVCCCCPCCCNVLEMARKRPAPATWFNTNYQIALDSTLCAGCGNCYGRCATEALTRPAGGPTPAPLLDSGRCIGCGLCASTCPSGALQLRPKPVRRTPPPDTPALYKQIYKERYGTLGLALAAARHLLHL